MSLYAYYISLNVFVKVQFILVHSHTHQSSVKDMEIVGPIISGASSIDWTLIDIAQPNMSLQVVPKAYSFFGST